MASNQVDKLTIGVEFDQQTFKDSANKIGQNVDDFVTSTVRKLEVVTLALGAFAGADIIAKMVTGFAETGSRIQYVADTLGQSTQQLQLFEQAARRTGGSVAGIDAALGNVQGHLNNIANGQDIQYSRILTSGLGVNLLDKNGQVADSGTILERIGQALYNKPVNGFQGQRYWENMLGLDPNAMRFLVQPKSAVDNTFNQVRASGIMDQNMVNQATAAQTALAALTQQFDYTKNLLANELVPTLIKVFTNFNHLIDPNSHITKDILTQNPLFKTLGVDKAYNFASNFSSIFQKGTPANELSDKISGGQVFSKYFNNLTSSQDQFNSMISGKSIIITPTHSLNNLTKSSIPLWDSPAVLAAHMRQESNGNPNAQRTDITRSGQVITTYGQYQMSQQAAFDATGKWYMPEQLKDPALNRKLRDAYIHMWVSKGQAMGVTDPRILTGAALAGYNGGQPDFNHFLKTGHSFNGYVENINNTAMKYRSLNNQSNISNGQSVTVNGDINVHGVQDAQGLSNAVHSHSNVKTAMAFSGGRLS